MVAVVADVDRDPVGLFVPPVSTVWRLYWDGGGGGGGGGDPTCVWRRACRTLAVTSAGMFQTGAVVDDGTGERVATGSGAALPPALKASMLIDPRFCTGSR